MYISQMHFVEGFAAGPNVDRRGRRYRPLSIHVACFFFSFREPPLGSEFPPLFACARPHIFFFLFTIPSSAGGVFFPPAMQPFPSFSYTLSHDKIRASDMEEHKRKNGKRRSRPTFSKTEDCANHSDGGHDGCA